MRVYEQAAGSVRVGQALVRLGHASEQQVLEALEEQRRTGERLGEIPVSRGVITRRQLYEALAYSLGVPFVDIANSPPDPESIRRLPAWMVRSRRILPLRESGGTLQLGMCDPRDQDAILEAEAYCKLRVQPCLIDEREFDRLAASLVDVPQAADTAGQQDQATLVVATDRPGPGGSVVEQVLEVAVRLGATDLHLSPTRSGYSVDVRVDGQLRNIARLDPETGQMAASRLKVLAGLDVAEKVRPQDGHFDAHVFGRDVDVRVASLGTPLGEKVSCRLLGRRSALVGLDRLGMTPQQAEAVRSVLRGGRGMLLFCGPVGSGKTTSMFACVAELEREPVLILSLPRAKAQGF